MDQMLQTLVALIPVGVLVTLGLNLAALHRSRRELAIKLHEVYLSPDFYSKVRAPAYHIGLQWQHLPDDVRCDYREAVVSGWAFDLSSDKLSTYLSEYPTSRNDVIHSHFQKPVTHTSLTEHQALTAFLRFWTRLNIHRKNGAIEKKLTRDLFIDEFCYGAPFLNELANAVEAATVDGHIRPRWIEDIRQLKVFFECREAQSNKSLDSTE